MGRNAYTVYVHLLLSAQAGGAMVYAGAVSEVKPYFVSCGFPFPEEHFPRSLPNASELLSYAPVANLF